MRWPGQRRRIIQTTLANRTVTGVTPQYTGTLPLRGDWVILRVILLTDSRGAVNLATRYGVRLATEIPTTEAEYLAGERLWYGDLVDLYFGDGFVVPGDMPVVVEGPFGIRPRGRRIVVRMVGGSIGAQLVAITFVLEQL